MKEKEEVESYGSCRSLGEAQPVWQWRSYNNNSMREPSWCTYRKTLYLFQNISLKIFQNYYGSKLKTTKFTIVSDEGGVPYTLPQDFI